MIKILEKIEDVNKVPVVPLRQWSMVIVHHTVTDLDPDPNYLYGDDIDDMHRKGHRDGYPPFKNGMGYPLLINPNGVIQYGDRWEYQLPGAHCRTETRTWNWDAIGVGIVGNFSKGNNHPTRFQLESWGNLKIQLMPRLILPHCAFKNTECPGRNLDLRNFYGAIIGVPKGRLIKEV